MESHKSEKDKALENNFRVYFSWRNAMKGTYSGFIFPGENMGEEEGKSRSSKTPLRALSTISTCSNCRAEQQTYQEQFDN